MMQLNAHRIELHYTNAQFVVSSNGISNAREVINGCKRKNAEVQNSQSHEQEDSKQASRDT